ncbi:MAG: PaaI family thioesterase [Leucothrix sp.]
MSKISAQQFHEIVKNELQWADEAGIRLDSIADGHAVMRLPFKENSLRPGGSISGPHMMLLADACMFAVVLSVIGEVKLAVTTNLNINFLRKPGPNDLLGEGKVIKIGKRLAVLEVTILDSSTMQTVAHATGTYSIPSRF